MRENEDYYREKISKNKANSSNVKHSQKYERFGETGTVVTISRGVCAKAFYTRRVALRSPAILAGDIKKAYVLHYAGGDWPVFTGFRILWMHRSGSCQDWGLKRTLLTAASEARYAELSCMILPDRI